MILGSGIYDCVRSVRRYRYVGSDQESLFGIAAIWLVLISRGPVLETFHFRARHRHHREVSIPGAGPINCAIQYQPVRTVFVSIDSCRRMTFDLVVYISYPFRRDRVEGVVTDSLIADAWTNRKFYLRYCLVATFYRN